MGFNNNHNLFAYKLLQIHALSTDRSIRPGQPPSIDRVVVRGRLLEINEIKILSALTDPLLILLHLLTLLLELHATLAKHRSLTGTRWMPFQRSFVVRTEQEYVSHNMLLLVALIRKDTHREGEIDRRPLATLAGPRFMVDISAQCCVNYNHCTIYSVLLLQIVPREFTTFDWFPHCPRRLSRPGWDGWMGPIEGVTEWWWSLPAVTS